MGDNNLWLFGSLVKRECGKACMHVCVILQACKLYGTVAPFMKKLFPDTCYIVVEYYKPAEFSCVHTCI